MGRADMGRKKKRPQLDTSSSAELTHNPFAALAPDGLPSPPPDAAPPAVADAPRFTAKVVVRREKKGRGGKTVTRISGIAPEHRAELAGQLKRALGCGATVEGDDVILQGALEDRAASWLREAGAGRVIIGTRA